MEKIKDKRYYETHAANTTITRNIYDFSKMTGNMYETVAMLSKRANQLAAEEKRELHKKIEEIAAHTIDTMDDYYENREQIELVRQDEQAPKPTLIATQEYLDDDLVYRNPDKNDKEEMQIEALENQMIAEEDTPALTKKKKQRKKDTLS